MTYTHALTKMNVILKLGLMADTFTLSHYANPHVPFLKGLLIIRRGFCGCLWGLFGFLFYRWQGVQPRLPCSHLSVGIISLYGHVKTDFFLSVCFVVLFLFFEAGFLRTCCGCLRTCFVAQAGKVTDPPASLPPEGLDYRCASTSAS